MNQKRILVTKYYLSIILSLLVFLISGCGELLLKQTEIVNGIDQDTVWVQAHSPYLLRGDILIPAKVTLTIEPGVKVTFSGNNKLRVEGTLLAEGSSTEPIWFRQAGKYYISGYYGIVFAGKQPKSNSRLKNCIITHARFAIYCDGDSPQLSYCTITGNNNGVHLWNSNASVSYNNISNNSEHGIYIGSMQPRILNNLITQNGRGIVCDYAPEPFIQQNDIFGNFEYDFYLSKTENEMMLSNNWWGTSDETIIRQKIYDKQKDGALGKVSISPIAQRTFTQ
ncbi:MAG: right-handed parallel beta-helix repeat-containing protein [bacterium]|nr:right-handed parallel beta-helix repeat-containing protein [bacterium]